MTLWEILKANKTGIAPDMFTMLAASKMNGGRDRLHELSGIPPLSFTAKGKPLTAWSITGNTVQNGTPTPDNPVEVQAVGDRTANLFDILTVYSDTTKFTINKNSVTATGRNFDTKRIKLADVGVGIGDAFVFSANILNSTTTAIGRVCVSIGGVMKQGFYKNVLEPYVSSITGTMETNEDAIWISYGSTGEINASNIMLNSGSTPLPYEPYGYKIPVVTSADGAEPITTPIYLPTPLYSGEVMRSDGSREVKWRKLVLTGKENAVKNNNDSTNYLYYIPMSDNKKINGYCSHLIGRSGAPISIIGFNMISVFEVLYLNFGADIMKSQSSGNTVAGFKEYLAAQHAAGTPITLWYQLAESTTETFTAPQIPTLNGTTVIDVDTAVKPERMTIKYRR